MRLINQEGSIKLNLLVFDIGGTSVKYSFWNNENLLEINSFDTPITWVALKEKLIEIKTNYAKDFSIDGVSFSFPGSIDQETGVILGASAVKYIHHFPIKSELEEILQLPVSLENDAKCAALAEVWLGAAKGINHVLFLVIGTGIGGAIVDNGIVRHGANLYAGEFGFAILDVQTAKSYSDLASPVRMAQRYCDRIGVSHQTHSGKEVFNLADEGDSDAQLEVEEFYKYLSLGLFNLQVSIDPEVIVIGGALSANQAIIDKLEIRINEWLLQKKVKDFKVRLLACKFRNDANLIGAVKNFMNRCATSG